MKKAFFKTTFLLTTVAVFYLAVTANAPSLFDGNYEDKFNHLTAFFTLSLLLNRSSSQYDARIHNVTALLLFGIFIELVQYFIPYRDASALDVVADLTGILLFQTLLNTYRFTRARLMPLPA